MGINKLFISHIPATIKASPQHYTHQGLKIPTMTFDHRLSSKVSKLVVNADDFGESEEITTAIANCLDAGVVTSTTILTNMPGTALALKLAAARNWQISMGVHLNICEGKPLTQPSSMIQRDGRFFPKLLQAARLQAGRIKLKEVEAELRAQIAFVKAAGVQISHLDSHKHLHQLPFLAQVVTKLAIEFGIERVRCTLEEGFWKKGIRPFPRFSRLLRLYFAKKFQAHLAASKLRCPGRAVDMSHLMGLSGKSERIKLLHRPQVLTELFCHPGTEKSDKDKSGSYLRFTEYQFLRSDEFKDLLDEANVELVSFWEV